MNLPVPRDSIRFAVVPDVDYRHSVSLLDGEIPGLTVRHHTLPGGDMLKSPVRPALCRIFFLCGGALHCRCGNIDTEIAERMVYMPDPTLPACLTAVSKSTVLELQWQLNAEDEAELRTCDRFFPLCVPYETAERYRDPFKGEEVVSRALLPQGTIPRFALGSVEASGNALVGQHAHPLLDQFFFSFAENEMDLLIDCHICPMGGNTLVHIPLGSNHGVISRGRQHMHYLWIDAVTPAQKTAAIVYLNETHRPLPDAGKEAIQ